MVINAIAALGGLITAVVSLVLLRQGQRDRRELRQDQRRQQAELVTTWCDWSGGSSAGPLANANPSVIFVRNTSDQAVYRAFVDYIDPDTDNLVRIEIGPVPPGDTRSREVHALAAQDSRWQPGMLMPKLFFEDSHGRAWMRDVKGRLHQDPGPEGDGFFEAGGKLRLGIPRLPLANSVAPAHEGPED